MLLDQAPGEAPVPPALVAADAVAALGVEHELEVLVRRFRDGPAPAVMRLEFISLEVEVTLSDVPSVIPEFAFRADASELRRAIRGAWSSSLE